MSPLLFCLVLNPLSLLVDDFSSYQATATRQINHLLYMDNPKLFARSDVQSKILFHCAYMFSDEGVWLPFGLDKCAKLSVNRSKLGLSGPLKLSHDVDICELSTGEFS